MLQCNTVGSEQSLGCDGLGVGVLQGWKGCVGSLRGSSGFLPLSISVCPHVPSWEQVMLFRHEEWGWREEKAPVSSLSLQPTAAGFHCGPHSKALAVNNEAYSPEEAEGDAGDAWDAGDCKVMRAMHTVQRMQGMQMLHAMRAVQVMLWQSRMQQLWCDALHGKNKRGHRKQRGGFSMSI